MASALKYGTALRNQLADSLGGIWDGASLIIYDAAPPANPQTTYVGNILATLILPNPAFNTAVLGTVTKAGVWSCTISASGTAAGFRMISADTTNVCDGTAGIAADTPDLVFDNKILVMGGSLSDSVFSFTQPE